MKIRGKLISSFGAVTLAILLVYAAVVYVSFNEGVLQNRSEVFTYKVKAAALATANLIRQQARQYRLSDEKARNAEDSFFRGWETFRSAKDGSVSDEKGDTGLQRRVISGGEPELATLPLDEAQLLSRGGGMYLLLHEEEEKGDFYSLFEVNRNAITALLRQNLLLPHAKFFLSVDDRLLLEMVDESEPEGEGLKSFSFAKLLREEGASVHRQGAFLPLSDNLYLLSADTPFLGLHIDYLLPRAIFFAPLATLKNRIIAATILLAWVAVWVVLIVAYRLSKPLLKLSKVTNDMIAFNYGTPFEFAITGDEIGDLARSVETMRQRIESLVIRDPLTKTYNRRYLMHTFKQAFAKARRHREELACIIMDIDYFKNINDTYGHQAGDDVLRAIGALLQEDTRPYDTVATVARYGGEEFVLLLPDVGSGEALRVAERLRRTVAAHVMPHGIRCTMSLGVAVLEQEHESPDKLLNLADEALYRAKEEGRNRVVALSSGGGQAAEQAKGGENVEGE